MNTRLNVEVARFNWDLRKRYCKRSPQTCELRTRKSAQSAKRAAKRRRRTREMHFECKICVSVLLSNCEHNMTEQSPHPKLRSCHTHAVNHRISILHENSNSRGEATSSLVTATQGSLLCVHIRELPVRVLQTLQEFASIQR